MAVTTLAGRNISGSTNGMGTFALFRSPYGIVYHSVSSEIYISESTQIRLILTTGVVTAIVGIASNNFFRDGMGSYGGLWTPGFMVESLVDNSVWMADPSYCRVRRITSNGQISTVAGGGCGYADGMGTYAKMLTPYGLGRMPNGDIIISDSNNAAIRLISVSTGQVTTIAGGINSMSKNAIGTNAGIYAATAVSFGMNESEIYIANSNFHNIRKATVPGFSVSLIAGSINSLSGTANGMGTFATFSYPCGITVSKITGHVYVADFNNNMIRRIYTTTQVVTWAGSTSSGMALL
jgi:DNA-binding beta-propeller fold protein YncE